MSQYLTFAKMHALKSLATFSVVLFASIVTASVRLHVESGQDVLETVPQEHISSALTWINCGSEGDIFQPSSVSIDPDPPVNNQNLTVTFNGTTTTPIEDGAYADVTVLVGLVKILRKTFDICELDGVKCPLTLNNEGVATTFNLQQLPPAIYRIEIRPYSVNDEELACINMRVDNMKRII